MREVAGWLKSKERVGDACQDHVPNPWTEQIPPLVRSSQVVVAQMQSGGSSKLKVLTALELFQYAGWDLNVWEGSAPYESMDEACLMDLFLGMPNAFVVSAVIMSLFGAFEDVKKVFDESGPATFGDFWNEGAAPSSGSDSD